MISVIISNHKAHTEPEKFVHTYLCRYRPHPLTYTFLHIFTTLLPRAYSTEIQCPVSYHTQLKTNTTRVGGRRAPPYS